MKKSRLFLKLISVFVLVYNAIGGSLFLIALVNHDFVTELSKLYLAELTLKDSAIVVFLYFGFVLHLLNVIALSWLMLRANLIGLILFLFASVLIIGMRLSTLSYEGYQNIYIQSILIMLVSLAFYLNGRANRRFIFFTTLDEDQKEEDS